ncbi:hypothetical protein KGY71_01360 [Candidatus Bipolaricaulota bacterium]|nr:hypothetical protein [Candidatus Bipolaricaulota bacterium]
MTLSEIKQKANRLDGSEDKNGKEKTDGEVGDLREEFQEVRESLLRGEDYIDEHPEHREALERFKKLLERTAEINSRLIDLGEKPEGRERSSIP